MCLINVTTTEPLIAEEDITVYKFIEKCFNNWKELVNHGDECIAVINNETVQGKISIDSSGELFICTDNPNFDGNYAEDMLGYNYSWAFDNDVKSLTINGKNIVCLGYRTIWQNSPVKIGKTYKSELISEKNTVNIGLHSYIEKQKKYNNIYKLVQCVIPKGSNYFIGDYEGRRDSIASDTLKYVKIVEKNIFIENILLITQNVVNLIRRIFHIK